ncbi:MAG: hypothetical protein OJF49_002506 [Ktedonobacterales bacterium]|jgi:uncharacterized protein (DUF433 family)|nr:MAG: hypothetical protein OJF49_002506 [Ktedonobacterales bacterium]
MTVETGIKYIVREDGVLGGKPHVQGHRIAVHHIAWWYLQGVSAESLAQEYALTPAEVHAALAYYYDHQDEIDRELAAEAAEHAARADADTSSIAQRMRAAIAARKQSQTHG